MWDEEDGSYYDILRRPDGVTARLKVRSMVPDAEARTGPVQATEHDPRITRVGAIIRKLRIDELAQILISHML